MTTDNENHSLRLERVFESPQAEVFRRFQFIGDWWCPAGFETAEVECDFRNGGKYRIGMRDPSGEVMFVNGVFERIEPPDTIAFTHTFEADGAGRRWIDLGLAGHPTHVTITFQADGDGTRMIFVEEALPTREAKEALEHGWGSILDRFLAYVTSSDTQSVTPDNS